MCLSPSRYVHFFHRFNWAKHFVDQVCRVVVALIHYEKLDYASLFSCKMKCERSLFESLFCISSTVTHALLLFVLVFFSLRADSG